jgi:hypothetical protein
MQKPNRLTIAFSTRKFSDFYWYFSDLLFALKAFLALYGDEFDVSPDPELPFSSLPVS